MWYNVKNDNRGGNHYEYGTQAAENFFLAFYENAVYCGSDSCGGSDCNIVYTHDYAGVKSNIRSIYSDYLLDLSISYGREMESAMQVNIDLLDNPEAAQDILQQLDIAGAKTAYAYLVGFDGTMLYHPTAEKIGQPVENDAVKKMLKEIQGGSIPKPETVQYVFQGEKKLPHVIPAKTVYPCSHGG